MKTIFRSVLRRTISGHRFFADEANIRRALDELHDKYCFYLTKY